MGLFYIAAILRKDDQFDIKMHNMNGRKNEAEIDEAITNTPKANIYGLSVVCSIHKYAKRIAKQTRILKPNAVIVVGDPNPSTLPEITLSDLNLDPIVIGEGEDAFHDLLLKPVSGSEVPRLITGIERQNIDSYPLPAKDLVDMSTYTKTLILIPAYQLHRLSVCLFSSLIF
jgi:radical SAM superfamily enzyme YgiQ (UPF0313 family)